MRQAFFDSCAGSVPKKAVGLRLARKGFAEESSHYYRGVARTTRRISRLCSQRAANSRSPRGQTVRPRGSRHTRPVRQGAARRMAGRVPARVAQQAARRPTHRPSSSPAPGRAQQRRTQGSRAEPRWAENRRLQPRRSTVEERGQSASRWVLAAAVRVSRPRPENWRARVPPLPRRAPSRNESAPPGSPGSSGARSASDEDVAELRRKRRKALSLAHL